MYKNFEKAVLLPNSQISVITYLHVFTVKLMPLIRH